MNLPSHHTGRHAHAGLARIDILVLATTLVIAGAMLLPAGARTDGRGNAIRCLSNHQRLAKAWLSFAMDNAGQLPGNADPVPGAPLNWATGWLDYASNPDNTNRLRLVNGALGPWTATPRYSNVLPTARGSELEDVSIPGFVASR